MLWLKWLGTSFFVKALSNIVPLTGAGQVWWFMEGDHVHKFPLSRYWHRYGDAEPQLYKCVTWIPMWLGWESRPLLLPELVFMQGPKLDGRRWNPATAHRPACEPSSLLICGRRGLFRRKVDQSSSSCKLRQVRKEAAVVGTSDAWGVAGGRKALLQVQEEIPTIERVIGLLPPAWMTTQKTSTILFSIV